jgi:hypothetical protein
MPSKCLRNELTSSERRFFDKKRGRGLRQNFIPKISNFLVILMILARILDLMRSWRFLKLFQYSPQTFFRAVFSLYVSLLSSRVVLVGFDIWQGSNSRVHIYIQLSPIDILHPFELFWHFFLNDSPSHHPFLYHNSCTDSLDKCPPIGWGASSTGRRPAWPSSALSFPTQRVQG